MKHLYIWYKHTKRLVSASITIRARYTSGYIYIMQKRAECLYSRVTYRWARKAHIYASQRFSSYIYTYVSPVGDKLAARNYRQMSMRRIHYYNMKRPGNEPTYVVWSILKGVSFDSDRKKLEILSRRCIRNGIEINKRLGVYIISRHLFFIQFIHNQYTRKTLWLWGVSS